MQHLKGVSYSDVMAMPTYERRFFLGLLTKDAREREEKMEEMRQNYQNNNARVTKTTRISGDALKSRFNSGDISLQ